jgi:hypothetical protein
MVGGRETLFHYIFVHRPSILRGVSIMPSIMIGLGALLLVVSHPHTYIFLDLWWGWKKKKTKLGCEK